jgi:SAM-dependent methyltransferase
VSVPSFGAARAEWARLPVDDVGYLEAAALLHLPDSELFDLVIRMERTRYDQGGYRNWRGLWREVLGLDATHNQRVLDYGCGVGVEALQYARAGNRVWLADLTAEAVELAARVLRLHGYTAADLSVIDDRPPYVWFADRPPFDVVHMSGVLHHIWKPRPVVERAWRWLAPHGELRLMVYSDVGWRVATASRPPEEVTGDPGFTAYVRFMDSVGCYADWYSADRLTERFGDLFTLERCEYLTPDRRFLAAVLRRRPG